MRTNFQMIMDIRDYCPEHEGMTSMREIKMLNKHFDLDKMSRLDLQNLRDMVVLVYSNWMNDERSKGEMDKFFKLSDAMQSIACVIDHYKMNLCGEL